MQKDSKDINESGIQVIGISFDSTDILKKFSDKSKISFPLLSDKDSEIIKAFGVLNEQGKGRIKGVPHPATFVIGTEGVIRAKLSGTVRIRHTTKELLKAKVAK